MNKRLLLLSVLCLSLNACTLGGKMPQIVKELGKDPATVHLRITSIYGVVELTRTAPTSNSIAHTVAPDGTITVGGNYSKDQVSEMVDLYKAGVETGKSKK